MLLLLFYIGNDRYALDARQVAEVLPIVALKQIPATPPWVAGVFSYRGAPLPVIDLKALATGQPAQRRLGTRIMLVHYPAAGANGLLGVVVERATETVRREASEFRPYGVDNPGARYLGRVADDPRGLIQWINIADLLPEPVRMLLFPVATEET